MKISELLEQSHLIENSIKISRKSMQDVIYTYTLNKMRELPKYFEEDVEEYLKDDIIHSSSFDDLESSLNQIDYVRYSTIEADIIDCIVSISNKISKFYNDPVNYPAGYKLLNIKPIDDKVFYNLSGKDLKNEVLKIVKLIIPQVSKVEMFQGRTIFMMKNK